MNGKHNSKDKRQFKRARVSFTVIYKVNSPLSVSMTLADKEQNAIALDLSEGGIAVLTAFDIPVSSKVTVRFVISNQNGQETKIESKAIEVKGSVRYSFLTKEKTYRIGICFINLSDRDRIFISRFVGMLNEKQGM